MVCRSSIRQPPLDNWKPSFFYVQTDRETKIENKKCGFKKRFLQFLLSMYVFCVFVCLCVCLSVITLQSTTFKIGFWWNFNIDTYMWIAQNGIFYFLHFLSYPLFNFLVLSLFQGYKSTYHENQCTKLKLGTIGIYYV